jgi:hypothetical protein
LEDLFRSLWEAALGLGGAIVALLFIYLSFRIGAMAVLKSIDEHHRRQAQKENSRGIQVQSPH